MRPSIVIVLVVALTCATYAFCAEIYPLSRIRYEGMPTGPVSVLSDGDGFLAVFGNHLIRLSSSGEILDPVPRRIELPGLASALFGTWTGDSYLVARTDYEYPRYPITIATLDREGNVAGTPLRIDENYGSPNALVRAGTNYLLVSSDRRIYGRLLDASEDVIRPQIFPADAMGTSVAAVPVVAGALVVSVEPNGAPYRIRARVVNENGDIVRDSIVSTDAVGTSRLFVAPTSNGAIAVWNTRTAWNSTQNLRVAIFDANGSSQATAVLEGVPPAITLDDLVAVSDGVLVYGSRYESTQHPGTFALGRGGAVARGWMDLNEPFLEICSNGKTALGFNANTNGLTVRVVNADGSSGPVHEFPSLPSSQASPSIACGISDCLVVWSEQNRDGTYSIRANALDPEGRPLRAESIEVSSGPGYNPVVARSADEYLVVYQEEDNPYYGHPLFGRRFDATAEPLDPAPFLIDADYGAASAVASDGRDFLVARARYPYEQEGAAKYVVTGQRVAANGGVGPLKVLSTANQYPYGFASLAFRGGSYLLGYGDMAPCVMICPATDQTMWTRTISTSGEPDGLPNTVVKSVDIWDPIVGATASSSLATWWRRDVGYEAVRLSVDGSPDGEPMTLPFEATPPRQSISTDQSRFYFAAKVAQSNRRGFVALNESGSAAVGMPYQTPASSDRIVTIGIQGSGRPRLIISEGSSIGVSRLAVMPVELSSPQANLALRIDGMPAEVSDSAATEAVIVVANTGDSEATDIVVRVDPGRIVDADEGTCTESQDGVTCEWASMAAHDTRRLRVRFGIVISHPFASEAIFRASVACAETDPDASDNVASQTFTILPAAKSRAIRR